MTQDNNRGRRTKTSHERFLRRGPFYLDLNTREVQFHKKFIPLPACAFECLATLLRSYPEPVSYKSLSSTTHSYWLSQIDEQDKARLHIYILRKAIEQEQNEPRYIVAVPGFGYRLVP